MSFIVKQKNKGKVYLYKATSVWNKDKKQSRQKRIYLGRDPDDKKSEPELISTDISTKNYGNILLLEHLSKKLGLEEVLKTIFPDYYREVLWLSYFDICAASPTYMFNYWLEEHDYAGVRKMNSSSVSELHQHIGGNDGIRIEFINKWIEKVQPNNAIYYDVTSISSYSKGIETVEWGYNRDKEQLPQINMGIVFSKTKSLPVYYDPYQGSVPDVSTLNHCLLFLKNANMKDVIFVLDRGFFSGANITAMNDKQNGFSFIQPIPMSVNAAKDLLYKHRKHLRNTKNALMYNEELWYYYPSDFEYCNNKLFAHIYYNSRLANLQSETFTIELLKTEAQIKQAKCKEQKEFTIYKNSEVAKKYREFFKWNRKLKCGEIDLAKVNKFKSKFGCFILSTNMQDLNPEEVLDNYRQKDKVEKMFDIVKNELDGDRLRTHKDSTTRGRLFIRFISLIIYAEISRIMKKEDLYKKMSTRELMAEMKKVKKTQMKNNNDIFTVLSKRQKLILNSFQIEQKQFV